MENKAYNCAMAQQNTVFFLNLNSLKDEKEPLTKEDRIILKKRVFWITYSSYYFLLCLGLWGCYIYYFREELF
jgi:hypothetical protein